MRKILVLITIFLGVSHSFCLAQKRSVADTLKPLYELDTADVRQGRHLERAVPFTISQFIALYAAEGPVVATKKFGRLRFAMMYKDQEYTYFAQLVGAQMLRFLTVRSAELQGVPYERLDHQELKEKFIRELVPQRLRDKEAQCGMGSISHHFDYHYVPATGLLGIVYRYKVRCDIVVRFNKVFTAKYDLHRMEFVKE